jgi:DNA-binding MurR/RpiR family transcriptional regulator
MLRADHFYTVTTTAPAISDRIIKALDAMPAQLQAAARYVLENPRDVALLSMREQARRAGLQPATMTRFAKRLGLEGYDDIRALHADAIRRPDLDFAGKASAQVSTQRERGDRALAADMAATLARQVARLAEPELLDALTAAAASLHGARRIYCMGMRSCHAVAWHLHYILSLFSDRVVLLDHVAGIGLDPIRTATAKDILVVASVRPYTRATIEGAQYATDRGVPVLAFTDSKASPLVRLARHSLLVTTESPSFFHTMTPAFALAEMLATLAAGRGGDTVAQALKHTENQLAAFHVHWTPKAGRRRARAQA